MPKLTQYLLLALLLHAPLALATDAVPPLINYQGTLTNENGAPVNGTRRLEFSIYNAPIGGNRVWGPQVFDAVPVIGGRFNVILGSTDTSDRMINNAFESQPRFIELQTTDTQVLVPRQEILSSPYAIQALNAINGVPPGSVIAFAGTNAPSGWLNCDGQTIDRAKYPNLFAAIGAIYGEGDGITSFQLPDCRGEFLRGLDEGRGIDEGRVLGSFQSHALERHYHKVYWTETNSPLFDTARGSPGAIDFRGASGPFVRANSNAEIYAAELVKGTEANETRPRNIAVNYIIKY